MTEAGKRLLVVGLMAAVILGVVNYQIFAKERIVRDGVTILLPLAPRDPRSLMQGDYMALRYAMASNVASALQGQPRASGRIVVELDADGVARFVAVHRGQPLGAGQHLLAFRKRGENVRLASDAFFFEEGRWQAFSAARFGELKVSADGQAVLVGLRDGERVRLPRARQGE